jgi:hypothetical protein
MPLTENQMYDSGFRDGVRFVILHVRRASDIVRENSQTHYANKLRELADEMERLITQ